jgi:hypothetical protein
MVDWEQSKHAPARLELLETYWRFRGPSGRVLECAVYQTNGGLEVRAGYGPEDALYTMRVIDEADARERAARLREAVTEAEGFDELQ